VELRTFKGKIDFHALRVAYINMLITSGADFKTVLELSRHTAAYMTALYARTEDDRIDKAVESVGERIISAKPLADDSFGFALRLVQ
jgi:site-specific recombinase XerD